MKTILIILGAFVLLAVVYITRLFTRLGKPVNAALSDSYYYHSRKKLIVYSPMGNWFELGYTEMPEADPETFTVLARDFGKDKNAVYLKGATQKVDHASFIIDEHGIPKDALHVYYHVPYSSTGLSVIEGADPKTYQPYLLPEETYHQRWGKDHQAVYLYGKKVDADGKTFVRINQTLAFDSLNLYAVVTDYNAESGMAEDNTRVIRTGNNPGKKPEAVNDQYARFGNMIAISNWKIDYRSVSFEKIDTIQVLDDRNIVVNNILVSDGQRLDDIDVSTLEIIGRDYLKDKNSVYYDAQKIAGADAETFVVFDESYGKDHKHVFYKTQLLPNLNPEKVTISYTDNTVSDGTWSYRDGVLVQY